jgi:hypothetical protein
LYDVLATRTECVRSYTASTNGKLTTDKERSRKFSTANEKLCYSSSIDFEDNQTVHKVIRLPEKTNSKPNRKHDRHVAELDCAARLLSFVVLAPSQQERRSTGAVSANGSHERACDLGKRSSCDAYGLRYE